MTADTKAVKRWEIGFIGLNNTPEMLWHYKGSYILFTDHEQVVGNLRNEAKGLSQSLTDCLECEKDYLSEIAELRAEVEALRKDAKRYRWIRTHSIWDVSITEETERVIDEELENNND